MLRYPAARMIQEVHHIGIAVRSIDDALPRWQEGFGLELIGTDDVPSEKVRVAMLRIGHTRIELLESTDPEGPIGRFLEKHGPGIHHIALQTDGIENQVSSLRAQNVQVLGDGIRPGAHGTTVAFLHPKSLDGVLTEVVEESSS